ncbi:MAG TPA: hypothetical protein VK116_04795 [Planctomycetota bacterium]|nr:hypothetical protein [Planctomycetota bacterium]
MSPTARSADVSRAKRRRIDAREWLRVEGVARYNRARRRARAIAIHDERL